MAQVVSDDTLPAGERSQVSGDPNFQVDGGARRGGNLFHSFSQLSVPTGGSIYFNNAADVQTIFSRVTGGAASNIDGLIRANGTANLFLLNPNGILFGPNGELNIGGSFVATTANDINFADGFQYGATNPQTAPLLTISAPIGLQLGENSGQIEVQGNGYDLSVIIPIFTPLIRGSGAAGLQVPAGQTLALIGGDVDVDGATLTAEQGHIELGSVRDGQVSLRAMTSGFAFAYQGSQRFGNIRLSQQALADASGGGVIQVQGNQVSLADGSLLLIQNQGVQPGGNIRIQAASSLNVSGESPTQNILSGLHSETTGSGGGANIAVLTPMLVVQEGGEIVTYSFGSGRGGNVTVSAPNKVQISGVSPSGISNSRIISFALSSGTGGDITLSTRGLIIDSGATILTITPTGTGRGGDVVVDAADSIAINGANIIGASSDTISSLGTSSGTGDAGNLIVNTRRLTLSEGGSILTSTFSNGDAGSLTINALESVDITGRAQLTIPVSSQISSSGFLFPFPGRTLTGGAGDIAITTGHLSVTDGAKIDVSNQGTGDAGTLRLVANSVVLDGGGSITAATASGEGGNLDLNVRNFLLLRNNSSITASASGTGNGGNIDINVGSIVAIPNENSDIRANSVNARGGNVTINTSGIFGLQFRSQETPLSDITATGANSASSGTVQLNINQLDPTFGLVELPDNLIDPSRLIAQGCLASQGNFFVVTGRGGLPPNPEQQLDDDADWQDRRRLVARSASLPELAPSPTPTSDGRRSTSPLIEATALQIAPNGAVRLVAPEAAVHDPVGLSIACQGGE
ncbi:filamentous hemagglutinin N-terminal domain-containing protein [Nodosilinea sp. AN01ver1]|uniref:two-partner secretion domain-containing protein n=1 Tax=Nodosilinea sp. AN01ver1 TaxID=3423362 RepID=UPI003D316E0D